MYRIAMWLPFGHNRCYIAMQYRNAIWKSPGKYATVVFLLVGRAWALLRHRQ
jgi:hypothetical protein